MTLTVGRAVLDNTYGDNTYRLSMRGDDVTIAGTFFPDSNPAQKRFTFQQQWLGLMDSDVVPVVCTERPELDGMYVIVRQPSVDYVPATTSQSGHLDVSLRMVRLARGFASPGYEVVWNSTSGYRLNNQISGTPGSNTALGYIHNQVIYTSGLGLDSLRPIAGTSASTTTLWYGSTGTTGIAPFGANIADFYLGAATVLVDDEPAVGKQIFTQPTVTPHRAVSITNGVIRFQLVDHVDGNRVRLQMWNGSAWGVAHDFKISVFNLDDFQFTATLPRVLVNAPEYVCVEWVMDDRVNGPYGTALQVGLRRGATHIEATAARFREQFTPFGVNVDVQWLAGTPTTQQIPGQPGVTSTGRNIRAASNDADGERVYMMAPFQDGTTPSTTGLIEAEPDSRLFTQFALGIDDDTQPFENYMHASSETQITIR